MCPLYRKLIFQIGLETVLKYYIEKDFCTNIYTYIDIQ